jgi:choline dehydrogenase-like flavoprotein
MPDAGPSRAAHAPTTAAEKAVSRNYDAVIIGADISGAILAHELTRKGHRVLVLEVGLRRDLSQE